jgi:hypothetical protein
MAVTPDGLAARRACQENQAIEILEKQANRFEHYPELRAKVQRSQAAPVVMIGTARKPTPITPSANRTPARRPPAAAASAASAAVSMFVCLDLCKVDAVERMMDT